jgi:hypothetical protein
MKLRCWNTAPVVGLSRSPGRSRCLGAETVSVCNPSKRMRMADVLLTQPKLQNIVHQLPKITSQAAVPPSGARWVDSAGPGPLG